MMPLMTSALKTLSPVEVARGSTLVNILQQIGGSVGTATMSVILTSRLNGSTPIPGAVDPQSGKPITEAGLAIASKLNPGLLKQFPVPGEVIQRGLSYAAHSFATTYWVGFALMLAVFIPIAFLPRKRVAPPVSPEPEGEPAAAAPIIIH
jgi:hypothetical protein